jgi:acid phosphatase (class A)
LNISSRVFGSFGALTRAALLAALIPTAAPAQDHFPDRLWAADLLILLEAGPAFLDPDLDLRVPPPPGPEETRSELDRMQLISARLRDERSRARILMEAEADPRDLLLAEGLIPEPEAAPTLWEILERAGGEATYFALREKRKFSRLRPATLRPELGATIPDPPHPAYPSGHSTQIHTLAGLLATLRPECEGAYRLFAAGVAFRREIAGVHFPSDTRAGEILAGSLLPHVLSHPDISEVTGVARNELRSVTVGAGCRSAGRGQ